MGMFDQIKLNGTRKHACCKRRISMLQTKDLECLMDTYVEGATKLTRPVFKLAKAKDKAAYTKKAKGHNPFNLPLLVNTGRTSSIKHPQNVPITGYDYCDKCNSMSYIDGVFDATGRLFILGDAYKEREDNA